MLISVDGEKETETVLFESTGKYTASVIDREATARPALAGAGSVLYSVAKLEDAPPPSGLVDFS